MGIKIFLSEDIYIALTAKKIILFFKIPTQKKL